MLKFFTNRFFNPFYFKAKIKVLEFVLGLLTAAFFSTQIHARSFFTTQNTKKISCDTIVNPLGGEKVISKRDSGQFTFTRSVWEKNLLDTFTTISEHQGHKHIFKIIHDKSPKDTFKITEEIPQFPGGDTELFKYLRENVKYPKKAIRNNIEGIVYVGFIINRDGSITDVSVKRGIGGGCTEEALRVVKLMPNWDPGRQQGKAVRVAYTLPIKFKLE